MAWARILGRVISVLRWDGWFHGQSGMAADLAPDRSSGEAGTWTRSGWNNGNEGAAIDYFSEMIWRLESAQVVSCCVYEVPNNRDNEWPNLFGHLLLPHSSIFFQSIIVIKFVTKTFQKLANLVTLPLYHHHCYLRDLQLIVDLDGVQILVLLHFT